MQIDPVQEARERANGARLISSGDPILYMIKLDPLTMMRGIIDRLCYEQSMINRMRHLHGS